MESFYLEEPSLERKNDVIDYMQEHIRYNSDINGSGSFNKVLGNESYESLLEKNAKMADKEYAYSVDRCPSKTYFLIRENDNRLIGMINIRHDLNEIALKYAGHIGYGIRPTERRKGYNKMNLYLGLIKARDEFNLDRVMLGCRDTNAGSYKTIQAFDGVLERTEYDSWNRENINVYWIDVNAAIEKYKNIYECHSFKH